MPEMDGFAATAEIRRREGAGPRTPIVAMTANALEGDRRRCLEAGMDDYIAKPVTLEDMAGLLGRWDRPLDENALARLAELGGQELVDGLVDDFSADARARSAAMLEHAAAGRLEPLSLAAHSLKGSSATIGAAGLARLCARLEEECRRGRRDEAGQLAREIEEELKCVIEALARRKR